MDISDFGRTMIVFGVILTAAGLLVTLGGKIPGFGRLPGDIFVQRDSLMFYFPVVTSILVSITLTIILNLFIKR